MDKRDYNTALPFVPEFRKENLLSGGAEITNLGNISANISETLSFSNNNNERSQLEVALGYKNNVETSMFKKSKSFGAKVDYLQLKEKENSKTFEEIKGITAYTSGEIGQSAFIGEIETTPLYASMYDEVNKDLKNAGLEEHCFNFCAAETQPTVKENLKLNFLSSFFKYSLGKEKIMLNTDDLEIKNVTKLTGISGITFSLDNPGINGDARIMLEEGVELDNKGKNFLLKNQLSGGVLADLTIHHENLGLGLQPGVKLNGKSLFQIHSNKNLSFGASVQGNTVVTRVAKDYSFGGNIFGFYAPKNSEISFEGSIGCFKALQNLTIGGFNQKTENITNLIATLGVQLSDNTLINLSYISKKDFFNETRNYSTVAIGAKMTF